MQKKPFTELNLSPEVLKAVARMGFEEASPIQSESIPVLQSGADMIGQSQTGSGKTAAFAIPAIELVDPQLRKPQVLVLCPTRELAVQVAEEVSKLAFFKKGVRELPIYGGQSYERQYRGLEAGSQIIIGTPGRLIDHLDRGSLKLDALKMVILDEADRMLDMGFREEIERILEAAPEGRQTVFFSATLPSAIQHMIKRFARDPQTVKIAAQTVDAPTIEQIYYEVGRGSKVEVLSRLIDFHDFTYGIIFCATKMMVDELTDHLSARGYAADKLHGDMAQTMRERVIRRFRNRDAEFLVATDVAARGLDVEGIEVVFNFDLPQDAEDYVHRIGRTGRAGRAGKAITFVAGRELYKLQNIMRYTKGRIRRENVPLLQMVEEKHTSALAGTVRETLEKGEYKKQDELVDQLLEAGHASTDICSALLHLLAAETTPRRESIPEDNPRPARAERTRKDYPQYEGRNARVDRPLAGDDAPRAPFAPRAPREDFAPRPPRERPSRTDRGDFAAGASRDRDEAPRPRPARREEAAYRDRRERPVDGPRSRREDSREEPSAHSSEPGMVRLAMNTGREHGILPGDVVGVIAGAAKVPPERIGAISILPRKTLVDVDSTYSEAVLSKLRGIRFKGHKVLIIPAEKVVGPKGRE